MHHAHPQLLDSPPLVRYGNPQRVFGASPAAGTDFTFAPDGRFYTRLVSVFCRLVTDANVANREVVVELRDQQAQRYDLSGLPVVATANTTVDYAFNIFQPVANSPCDSTLLVPLHATLMFPSDDMRLHVVNVQAGDQLSRIRIVLEQFYATNQPPHPNPMPGQ
jgi:hypothetical protein